MGDKSKIEWTDATWNPITGCTKVSPGCAYCYIERSPPFRIAGRRFERGHIPLQFHPSRLEQPLRWARPRMIFVCSLADLFHDDVADDQIDHIFAVMRQAKHHTFQVLTKRPERMKRYVTLAELRVKEIAPPAPPKHWYHVSSWRWPLPNVWLGVTAENQRWADERIPLLLDTPAALHFLSAEPLLGPLNLNGDWYEVNERCYLNEPVHGEGGLDWVIVGGESGGPANRRLVTEGYGRGNWPGNWQPTEEAEGWVADIRNQCETAGAVFTLKQWGGPRSTSGGRTLEGREWIERPVL